MEEKKITWDLELNLWKFIHFYNYCRKHATTDEMSKHAMDNYNYKGLMEKVAIENEISRKWHIEKEMCIMRVILPYSQIGYQKLT